MLYPYRESLISQLYPGWQHSSNCLQPAVEAFEQRLNLPAERRHKGVWRLDGGFGGDRNIEYLYLHTEYRFSLKTKESMSYKRYDSGRT
jgi:hypothetical protein